MLKNIQAKAARIIDMEALLKRALQQKPSAIRSTRVRWSGFSGQGPSLTSEAGHHPHQGLPNDEQATNPQP